MPVPLNSVFKVPASIDAEVHEIAAIIDQRLNEQLDVATLQRPTGSFSAFVEVSVDTVVSYAALNELDRLYVMAGWGGIGYDWITRALEDDELDVDDYDVGPHYKTVGTIIKLYIYRSTVVGPTGMMGMMGPPGRDGRPIPFGDWLKACIKGWFGKGTQ